ncbi:TIGR01620 family protein [Rodentibacter caecimuris]|uniref:UPF0283 membrane protein BKG89_04430 n=1 Tax=Rodentibacter caecimuris TaxID=1796644 RepID=A0ABX3KYJ9_9PAST|nr:TIGR01620 family protein [Rodentibacter heylii]
MKKQIFTEQPEESQIENRQYQPKQEFTDSDIVNDDLSLEGELLDQQFERITTSKSTTWKTLLKLTALLFLGAIIAQSIQWLWDSYQSQQWISFSFALVSFSVVLFGTFSIINEWRRLLKLKRRAELQQRSRQFKDEKSRISSQEQSAFQNMVMANEQSPEQAIQFCLDIVKNLNLDPQNPHVQIWQNRLNESYSAQEISLLFSRSVLAPLDVQAKKLITKSATESALIVAISPLAIVDMFFLGWRNIRLINQIAELYGIELGYFTRLKLLRMILLNMAFAGATEFIQDMGMDWLSQDLTAKLSARAAQGIGVGLLTARLGLKTMEFCRPITFEETNKPRLSHIRTELLTAIKARILGETTSKIKKSLS